MSNTTERLGLLKSLSRLGGGVAPGAAVIAFLVAVHRQLGEGGDRAGHTRQL
jgi:hypothetical protein